MRHQQIHSRTTRSAGCPDSGRSAFTLLELLIALSVLLVLTTLAAPGMLGQLKKQTVMGNAEQVRQILDRARVLAVEGGRTIQVRYEPHGRKYVVLPLDQFDPNDPQVTGATTSGGSLNAAPTPVKATPYRLHELEEACKFHVDSSLVSGQSLVTERLGEPWMGHLENGMGADTVGWSRPILFYPDGSATDGTLVVMDQDHRYIKLHVRGLTGAVWLEPLAVMADRLGSTGN